MEMGVLAVKIAVLVFSGLSKAPRGVVRHLFVAVVTAELE